MILSTSDAVIFAGYSYFIIHLAFSLISSNNMVDAVNKLTYNFFIKEAGAP